MTEQEVKKFYNSKKWKRKRLDILKRDHFECQDCIERLRQAAVNGEQLQGEDRKIRRAEEVHHIKELREYPEQALEDPRKFIITTNGYVREGPLDDLLGIMLQILETGENPLGYFPFICRIDCLEEVDNEETWHKANPSMEYMGKYTKMLLFRYQEKSSTGHGRYKRSNGYSCN